MQWIKRRSCWSSKQSSYDMNTNHDLKNRTGSNSLVLHDAIVRTGFMIPHWFWKECALDA